jgi:LysR family glycine cleavage system transcriptional activator
MVRRYYDLPSLNTLAAFETAARNLSFKMAASELNVTPGAVSHQIKALECELDVVLFQRKHRGVELTESGAMLLEVLGRSFNEISSVLSFLKRSQSDPSISIAATSAVSSLWLTPRISQFWRQHEDIPVNQIVSDSELGSIEKVDISIVFGKTADTSKIQEELFKDNLVPVASPQIAMNCSNLSLAELAQQNLIHLDTDNTKWTSWHTWFTDLGYKGKIARGRRVNNYMIALQAAQDGAGIVLGWQRLISPLLEANKLVRLGTKKLKSADGFYLVSNSDELVSPATLTVKNWLLQYK